MGFIRSLRVVEHLRCGSMFCGVTLYSNYVPLLFASFIAIVGDGQAVYHKKESCISYFGIKYMAIVALTGQKGGTGKSTLTANLVAEFSHMRKKVIAFDCDPQRSLIAWAGLGEGILAKCVHPLETRHPEIFRNRVNAAARQADFVLIDTPPGFTDPALLAALCADLVLLPCGPSPLDLFAAREALNLIREARGRRRDGKPLICFIPSRVTHSALGKDLQFSLIELGEDALPIISQRIALAESVLLGLTVREFDPESPSCQEFKILAKSIMGVLHD